MPPVAVRAAATGGSAAPDRYVVVPGELLGSGDTEGLVSPVVRRRLATLVATRYPAAESAASAPHPPTEVPAGPGPPGPASPAAAERAGRSVG